MKSQDEYTSLDDEKIVSIVDTSLRRSIGYHDSELSQERRKVMDYYSAKLPRPAHDGNSKYVSQDVYDAVESMKAALLETFSTGNKTLRFTPQNMDDVDTAEVCTEYTDFVLHRQNNLFETMQTVIHDGLIARAGIAKIFWCMQDESSLERIDNLTEEELDVILSEENVEIEEIEQDDMGMFSGDLRVTRDTSQVKIEAIAPEEFLIEPQAKSLDTVSFCAHRTKKTISELIEMGYDEDLVADISDNEDTDFDSDPEILARFDDIGAGRGFNGKGDQRQSRQVTVVEAYIELDVEGTGVTDLYRVVKCSNVLLEKEVVSRRPFVAFVPLPIPHAFHGNNFAEKLLGIQNARTVLTRSILDHAMVTNNPRYTVVKGGLTNPRELIDNRVGGIVNVTRPDAINPMPQASLNPYVFQTIQMLDEDKEDTSGVSRLSQGLNKDAISKQNSAAMVEQLATLSQQRQKIIARNFANNFLKPLFSMVYQLVVENESEEKIVELAGRFVNVSPAQWADKRDVQVEFHLGYGDQEQMVQKHLSFHQMFSADPSLGQMYSSENKFKMLSSVLEKSGIKNIADFLTDPATIPPPPPDPAQEMQMQMAQKQLELQERQTSVAELKAQFTQELGQMKLQLDQMKAERTFALESDRQDLAETQFEHKEYVNLEELKIARTADDVRAIASPNG
tara:strand:+ start:4383 stop:6416 length:2034 start_codon:yes stop_codon:yes gene_type:complete